jgi:hypothetical protein
MDEGIHFCVISQSDKQQRILGTYIFKTKNLFKNELRLSSLSSSPKERKEEHSGTHL